MKRYRKCSKPTCPVMQLISLIGLITATEKQTDSPRSDIYEAYRVAPEKQLEGPRITGKGDPYHQVILT